MAHTRTPFISPEVVQWLEERFSPDIPEKMPVDPREYDFLVGQQSVVQTVKRISERQNTENLEDY